MVWSRLGGWLRRHEPQRGTGTAGATLNVAVLLCSPLAALQGGLLAARGRMFFGTTVLWPGWLIPRGPLACEWPSPFLLNYWVFFWIMTDERCFGPRPWLARFAGAAPWKVPENYRKEEENLELPEL